MEKILPHPIVPRFFDSPRDEKQHTDRMMVRGVQVVRDEDPGDRPKWRGDHSFSADAARYSFSNFIEPEVAKSHPSWTREQVREQSLEKFEKRLRQDQSFEQKESAHEESSISWQPVQTENGWELATAYGDTMITLSELWEHTREFAAFAGNPAAYNAKEHATQLRMQDAFIRGEATGFVSVLSHPDAIRYVQLWNKADDGSIVSTHIDLAKTTGRDFTHEEGATLIHHLQSVHGDVEAPESSYAHFFVRGESVSEHGIRTVAMAQTFAITPEAQPSHVDMSRFVADVGVRVLHDTSESMATFGAYLGEHIERSIVSFRERVGLSSGASDATPKRPGGECSPEQKGVNEQKKDNPVVSVLAEWWVTRSMVREAQHVPVAAVALLTWVTRLDCEHRLLTKKTRVIPSHEYTEVGQPRKEDEQMPGKILSAPRNIVERLTQLMTISVKKLVAFVTIEKKQAPSQSHRKRLESVRILDVVSRVLRRKRNSVTTHDTLVQHMLPRKTKMGDRAIPQEMQNEHVVSARRSSEQLMVAFLVWWIIRALKRSERPPVEIEHIPPHESVSVPGFPRSRLKTGTETNSPQWALLSIIWKLTLLREGGFAKKKQKKKSARSLLWHHISLRFVIE